MIWRRFVAVLALPLFLSCRSRPKSDVEYWEERARKHGELSVLNLGHTPSEIAAVTRKQMDVLFPILGKHLRGDEISFLIVVEDAGQNFSAYSPDLPWVCGNRRDSPGDQREHVRGEYSILCRHNAAPKS